MVRYKTVVTDYEGMQGLLDAHATQGWRLFSLTPDTWRKSIGTEPGMERAPFEQLTAPGDVTQEYSASYYLLVFQREDNMGDELRAATAEEQLPIGLEE
ncbi:MAG: hypothetical protein JO250_08065 [Armatimonadetes bacterium]|nr:hypothetical protein [Armatimonadota bacterium]